LCTKAKNGKVIERTIFTPMYEENRKNMEEDPKLYRRRQAIVEHPFGTIKRQWGFDHILSKKGKKRASADVGFIFIAYNLKRILSLMGKKGLREVYGQLVLCLSVLIQAYKAILMALYPTDSVNLNFCTNINPNLKKLILVHNWQ
jgi:hypothetical protein